MKKRSASQARKRKRRRNDIAGNKKNEKCRNTKVITFPEKKEIITPEVNIGTIGHVDHGKTSLVYALTGKWTSEHSEELKRGITIRLGYADAVFYYCEKCKTYSVSKKCAACFEDCAPKRAVSFVDSPGHETLMATVLSGTALMDGALLLIAASERCPQPQTAEHLKALDIAGIKNIVIVQNKIDLVNDQRALESYNEIKKFVAGTVAENAPIIPVSAIHNTNIDKLIEAIETSVPTPKRDTGKEPVFYVARSFDINKPGTAIEKLEGGIIGGSVVSGKFSAGDEIEIKPGVKGNSKWEALETKVVKIVQSGQSRTDALPGGLVAIQTDLDPALTKSDSLSGSIVGMKDRLPAITDEIKCAITLFDYVIGTEGNAKIDTIKAGDTLMLTVAIAKTVGAVASISKGVAAMKLKLPVVAKKGDRVSISKQMGGRWHLVGYGILQ